MYQSTEQQLPEHQLTKEQFPNSRPFIHLSEASMPPAKYGPYELKVNLSDRTWPDRTITEAPRWCSVDLRDGNQALSTPMDLRKKILMFKTLVLMGFREIEIGFPSSSKVEYDFTRWLVENRMIPRQVIPQVLVQAREHLINRTFEALEGVKRAVVHIYNPTSEAQRRMVFGKTQAETIDLAVEGVTLVKRLAKRTSTQVQLEYSPESFTGTEMPFAKKICEAVMDVWNPTPDNKIILNLPATVEMSTPNTYADQIEWFCRNINNRNCVTISIHPHNDRGTAVAAAELGLMAGAERVEGTLFGNGERTGNVCITTLAGNLLANGVDPRLNLRNMPRIKRVSELCTGMPVPPRHPYAGELVFTAFSGGHQTSIARGLRTREEDPGRRWDVPYLAIDPADIGRKYTEVVRVNSQSGRGGAAHVLYRDFGLDIPREMQAGLGEVVQDVCDRTGRELSPGELWNVFSKEYLECSAPLRLIQFRSIASSGRSLQDQRCELTVDWKGERILEGAGDGPIDAACHALIHAGYPAFEVKMYRCQSLHESSAAEAVAYIQISQGDVTAFGAGADPDTIKASIKALLSALNRAAKTGIAGGYGGPR